MIDSFRMTPRAADVLLAVGVTVVISIAVSAGQGSSGPVDPLAYLWAAGLGLLMVVRRTMPLAVLLLTALGYFTYYTAGFPAIGVAVPIAAAVYSATEAGYLRAAILTSVLVLAVSTTFRLLIGQPVGYVVGYELVGHTALIASVVALGSSVRAHRALREKTDQVARLTEHQTLLSAEARAREERLRLARELHDSIGHALAVASLHTNVAREAPNAEARSQALHLVRQSTSEAMTQLRSTVALLRSSAPAAAPAASLDQLPQLLRAPRAAGYTVEFDLADGASASPDIEAAAFRVVQEAVTNTLRHADADHLGVRLRVDDEDRLHVLVRDNGKAARPPTYSPGHGLAGMRERVEAAGGSLTVRAAADGWYVEAKLPRKAPDSREDQP
ncbi:sensor histidine kinase [Kribbella flavida]|uniref:sensor histidine kinase n=1 Tax=Kribbella flavida TaxID=182640 RepID=UPI00019BD98D|nr:sensor histidine kinase [Kribbella flavida]